MGGSVLSRLVVVSNRVAPPETARSGAQGGLAVALQAALEKSSGLWFGWSGEVSDVDGREPHVQQSGNVTIATIDLNQADYEEYYNGFANRALWPLCHYRLDLTDFCQRSWEGYQRVNQLFVDHLRSLLKPDDVIWVHDYHLIPLGKLLREAGCRQRIGFFLHIPWPALEIFLALPGHHEIVEALCHYDLIGFQTQNDLRGFHNYIELEAKQEVEPDGTICAFRRRLQARAFPISIDTDNVARMAEAAVDSAHNLRLRESLRSRQLMIGVDRLDYSKGLHQRLRAYESLLRGYRDLRGEVVFLQIAPPSRQDVPELAQMREELEAASGHVNGAYADFDWLPLRYLNKGFGRDILMGFLRTARVGVVTPLRDGMNLVAKEFVAAQDPEDPGVLVLSRFAGASAELEDAVLVNPYDIEGMAEALKAALLMPLDERRNRWRKMFERLQRHDVHAWRQQFLGTLTQTAEAVN